VVVVVGDDEVVTWCSGGGCLGLFLALVFCPGELERARCVDTPC
jgi:hypothetical protein